ncbi:hypothetical protein BB560_004102, partial [Smittium megazygosporum]
RVPPQMIDTRRNGNFPEDFSRKMRKAGGAVYSNVIPNNIVVLSEYLEEYAHLPEMALNRIQGHLATSNDNLKPYHAINRIDIGAKISKAYSDNIEIDVSDLAIYVLFENACLRMLGPSGIEIIKLEKEKYEKYDYISLTLGINVALSSMISIIPSRLLNILTDIASNPHLQSILISEQEAIIDEYGRSVTTLALSKMEILSASINESLLLSSSASCLHRKVKSPFVLSNGTHVPADHYISVNLFERYNTKKDEFRNRAFDIDRHLYEDIPEKKKFIQDSIWGYGSRKCPAIEYSLVQMKLFVIALLRNYHIFNNEGWFRTKHPGYRQIITVIPETSHIYLRRRRIE